MTLQKVPFQEWDALLGYRTIQDVVETLYRPVLFNDPINVPDDEKELFFIHHKPTSPYRAAYEDVLDNFAAGGEFNYELYFAMPYFVDIYKMWQQKQDYQWQFLFLDLIGVCLSTDFPYNHFSRHLNENLPKEIIENHLRSIAVIREEAKTFISEHLARLQQLTLIESQNFCQCLFAILGDREASYVLFMGNFNSCYIACPHCTDPEEDFGITYYFDRYVGEHPACSLGKEIQPAPSVIGQWDLKSYDDDYVWMSNLLYLLGNKDCAKKMSFYYGTFFCPNCGKEAGIMMDLAKQRTIWNEEK